jgi:DNA topoisomerase-2
MSIDQKYQKLTDVEHVLLRPGMYIGSIKTHTEECWVPQGDEYVLKEVTYNPGFLKLFDEIISNSVDEHKRNPKLNRIRATINAHSHEIQIEDNGGIPVEIHGKYNEWIPEMIFSNLKAGSNFDDTEERTVVGTNGVGSTLTNIFSHSFTVETCDGKKRFHQEFSENMSKRTQPKITSSRVGFTKITYRPDLERFGLSQIDDDHLLMITKRMHDLAACNAGITFELNGNKIRYASFKQYAEQYTQPVFYEASEHWKIGIGYSKQGFQCISFVNSVETRDGGTHVNHILNQAVSWLKEHIKKKHKYDVKPSDIKQHIFLFIDATVVNPAFSSQTKEKLITEPREFGTQHTLSDKTLKSVFASEILQSILDWIQQKKDADDRAQLRKLNQTIDKSKVLKLIDAKKKGDRSECSLAIFEGDSAKSAFRRYRDPKTQGAFPLRGKFMNVTETPDTKVAQNKEVQSLMASLGLRIGHPVKDLRYGRVLIYTDADVDGNSIAGLLINFFAKYWPELFTMEVIWKVDTPLMVAKKGKTTLSFYADTEYLDWESKQRDLKGWDISYKKGLAALEDAEYKEIIQHPNAYSLTKDDHFGHTISSWFAGDSSPRKDLIMQGPPDRSNVTITPADTHKKMVKGIKKTSKPTKASLF